MKFNTLLPILAGVVITAVAGLQSWTLLEVVNLKVKVAELAVRLDQVNHTSITANEHYPQNSVARR